jgi:hypothetical protein
MAGMASALAKLSSLGPVYRACVSFLLVEEPSARRTDADNVAILLVQLSDDPESFAIAAHAREPKFGEASEEGAGILSQRVKEEAVQGDRQAERS